MVLDRLRLGLLRLSERPDRPRALGADAGRGRDRERVPLPRRRARTSARSWSPSASRARPSTRSTPCARPSAAAPGRIALTNVVDSLLAREADGVLYTRAGPEIGVASTKCHAAQIAMLQLFALHLAAGGGRSDAEEASAARACAGIAARARRQRAIGRMDDYRAVAAAARRGAGRLLPRSAPRLRRRPRGRAQAEGARLRAGRGLPGRRDEARPDRAHRRRAPSSSPSPPGATSGRRSWPTSPR